MTATSAGTESGRHHLVEDRSLRVDVPTEIERGFS
jgi:hypothetical protein